MVLMLAHTGESGVANHEVIIQVVQYILHMVHWHGILKCVGILIEQCQRAVQFEGEEEVDVVETHYNAIRKLVVPRQS